MSKMIHLHGNEENRNNLLNEGGGGMKNIRVITRFLSVLAISCLLSLTVLSVSVVWIKHSVDAVPEVKQTLELD